MADTILVDDLDFDDFERGTHHVEIRVPWSEVTLYLVSTEAQIPEGAPRGRYWTGGELRRYMALEGRTPETLVTIAQAKLVLDMALDEVLTGVARRFASAPPPPAAPVAEPVAAAPVQAALLEPDPVVPPTSMDPPDKPSRRWREMGWAR